MSNAQAGGESINADEPWRNQAPKPGPLRTVQLPAPTSSTLSNGLTLILNERKELPIVAANLVFKTGSDGNPLEKPGLASFVAAMLDEGTTTRSAPQIAERGRKAGASLNTASSMDAMTVSGRSLARFRRDGKPDGRRGASAVVSAEEIERQRASRLGQLVQQRDNPGQVAAQVTAAALFGDRHPYGFTEIGTEASVKALGRDDMVAFWKQNFVPGNAALVVAGDISMPSCRRWRRRRSEAGSAEPLRGRRSDRPPQRRPRSWLWTSRGRNRRRCGSRRLVRRVPRRTSARCR